MIPAEVFAQTCWSFLQPIRDYLQDPTVSEVMVNGPTHIYVERKGQLSRTDASFESRDALEAAVRHLAQFVGKHVDAERPILEGRLPDGSRVQAILPPAAPDGPHLAIRRFFSETLTAERLIGFGSLTDDAVQLLQALVTIKQNIVVAGGTGSGKTSLLNVLSGFAPKSDRIVVIEDSRELQLPLPHVVQLEARPPDAKGRGQVTIRDLFRATLRMRPDRIVVGEIRGGEALDLVQAMTSGHGGCLSTVHATYPSDALNRLQTMALMGDVELPLAALRVQIGSAVHVIVQTSRLIDGSRVVTHITEVAGYDPQRGYELRDLFVRKYLGKHDEHILSSLEPTGARPQCLDKIQAFGLPLPASMYDVAQRSRSHRS
jgi:pilus assembly protein CpaF